MALARILVVDAHDDERRRCADLLRREGFDVVAVERPELAEGSLSGQTPVAALIEDAEPGLTRRLVALGVPVFGVSDIYSGATNRALAMLRDGVAEYWARPVPASELFGWLRRVVGDAWPVADGDRPTGAPSAVVTPGAQAAKDSPADATVVPASADAEPGAAPLVAGDVTVDAGPDAADIEVPVRAPDATFEKPLGPSDVTRPPWMTSGEVPAQRESTRVASIDAPVSESLASNSEGEASAIATPVADPEPWLPSALDVRRVDDAGDLADTSFATILAHLAYSRSTGALRLQRGDDKRLVYIEDGFPVSARTNQADLTVSDLIEDSGLLPDDAMQRVRKHAKQHRVSTSQALLELELFDSDELAQLASASLRNKLLDLFAWDDGVYSFKGGNVPRNYRHDPVVSPMDIIWEGVLHGVPVSHLRRALDPVLERPVLLISEPPSPGEMRLTPSQERFLKRIDGVTSWFALTREGIVNEDVQRLLYVLVATGIVAFGESGEAGAASA